MVIGFKREFIPSQEQKEYLERLFNIRNWYWNKLHEVMQNESGRGSKLSCIYKITEIYNTAPDYFDTFHTRMLRGIARAYSEAWKACFHKIRKAPKEHKRDLGNHASVTFDDIGTLKPSITCSEHKELALKNLLLCEPLPSDAISYKSVCFSRHNGKYFISGTYECPDRIKHSKEGQIGLDLGIKTFAVDNTGKEYKVPKRILRIQQRINKLQRALAKKQERSAKRQRVITKLEKAYTRKSNIVRDFTEKLSTQLLEGHSLIALETLDFVQWRKGQGKKGNNKLAASQVGYFVQRLKAKSVFYPDCKLVFIDPYYKSTQTCSSCGNVKPMKLSERTYICPHCGMILDRDQNAAVNILAEAVRSLSV